MKGGELIHALEVRTKGFVEFVVMLLVFHQGRACEVIEVIDAALVGAGSNHLGLQGLQ